MAIFGKDEDTAGMHLLALLGAGILALLLISMCSWTSAQCPEGTVKCGSDVSKCGCCVVDGFGNLMEYCEFGTCPSGYILNPQSGVCCESANPQNCLTNLPVCVNVQCNSQKDCCEGFACQNGLCKSCEVGQFCDPKDVNSCCTGLACNSQGKCEDVSSCAMRECAVPGEKCTVCDSNGNCMQCQDNSVCVWNATIGKNVCTPQEGTNQTQQACKDIPCKENKDCCTNYVCNVQTKKCASANDCGRLPCTNPGEYCKLCSIEGECSQCLDKTICAKSQKGESLYSCQPSCEMEDGRIGVVCPDGTGCCDPLTGDEYCGAGGHVCENVEGCNCCEYGQQKTYVCPENSLMCPELGCVKLEAVMPPPTCSNIDNRIVCKQDMPETECPKYTHACTDAQNSCCTYIVPADALPSFVKYVDFTECTSGYKYMLYVPGIKNERTSICCDVSYVPTATGYQYKFNCGVQSFSGESKIAPYEQFVAYVQLGKDACAALINLCKASEDYDKCISDHVVEPIEAKLGG
ncbi:MAG: hypothetical protein ACP5H8_02050 [Candidatus Micrarchaeia archaeon]